MGFIYQKRKKLGRNTTLNLSKGGASVSRKVGKRVTVNSRGMVSIKILPGLSFRFRLWK